MKIVMRRFFFTKYVSRAFSAYLQLQQLGH